MTGQDPESLQYFAYIAVAVGIAQLIYGLVQKRSPDRTSQGVAVILTWGAVGWFLAAAICYFGSAIDWVMIPALAVLFGVSGIGTFKYVRSLKSGGGGIVS